MSKILKEKKVRFSDLPDGFDIESLPEDTVIIFDEDFPELDDNYWEDDK
ncbi:MAG: hypothetical protein H2212_07265 [Ruminococcus sp.]|nr:hypothetical protein [Ruminococcus sp.]